MEYFGYEDEGNREGYGGHGGGVHGGGYGGRFIGHGYGGYRNGGYGYGYGHGGYGYGHGVYGYGGYDNMLRRYPSYVYNTTPNYSNYYYPFSPCTCSPYESVTSCSQRRNSYQCL